MEARAQRPFYEGPGRFAGIPGIERSVFCSAGFFGGSISKWQSGKACSELLDYAGHFNIRLGIENRFHYFDIPTFDEMGEILESGRSGDAWVSSMILVMPRYRNASVFPPTRPGWTVTLSGSSECIFTMWLGSRTTWLQVWERWIFASWLDTFPGMLSVHLKSCVSNTPEQIKAGMKILVDTGCVNLI